MMKNREGGFFKAICPPFKATFSFGMDGISKRTHLKAAVI
jgi:hypothetical protein